VKVKFLNPFVDSACEILQLELNEKVDRGDLHLENGLYVTDDVTVILSLIGSVEGTVFYSMSKDVSLEVTSRLMDKTFDTLDKLVQSGVAELGNVITGRASMKLAAAGYAADISTPALIMGKGATISTLDHPRLIVPLLTSMGTIMIHLALRERL
jgi:chemotaxis protein CheX